MDKDWLTRFTTESSLRVKVTIGVVLPLMIFLGLFTAAEYYRQRQVLLSNLSIFAAYSAQTIEDNLLHQMLEADFAKVQDMLDTIGGREEFQTIYILDDHGKIIFSPNGESQGRILDNSDPTCQPCHSLPVENRAENVIVMNEAGNRVFRSMHPLENSPVCSECHDPDERLLGLLLTDISLAPALSSLEQDLLEKLLWWLFTVFAAVIGINLVLDRTVFRRLENLALAIRRFGQGEPPTTMTESGSDAIARLSKAFHQMANNIEKRREENDLLSTKLRRESLQRGELLRGLITAQENERKRVARDIHDVLGQSLAALALQIEGLKRLMEKDADRALNHFENIQPLIATVTEQMYDIILDLRPSSLDDLGLIPTLHAFSNRLKTSAGIDIEIKTAFIPDRFPAEIETTLFRIFQEALNNSVRHGRPSQIKVNLTCHDHTISGQIWDDGSGFDLSAMTLDGNHPRGLGLLGMQERALQCGGEVRIFSRPGKGTSINFEIPFAEEISE